MRQSIGLAFAIASVVFATSRAAQEPATGKVDFARDVQPILRQQCYGCHGPTKQTNGFRLDRRSDAMRGVATPSPAKSPRAAIERSLPCCSGPIPPF